MPEQEEGEKKKEKELLERKRQFADRFKNRGKRDHSEISESSSSGGASGSAGASDDVLSHESQASKSKKAKLDEGAASSPSSLESKPLTEYRKEMQNINTESLKGGGIGVRPLTK
ncbi:hypothetical protein FA13DRAFT_1724237 [Coprinellus micaceus]|uniref:Uncharacterized protein n=1 Tax=Coprinellus micaceus TaxID=71717 RepID=A0A4Y7U0Q2_COPMI|nr:hypothetical protein FA13DRAFT_1724237 [Coprinellus micaceus]